MEQWPPHEPRFPRPRATSRPGFPVQRVDRVDLRHFLHRGAGLAFPWQRAVWKGGDQVMSVEYAARACSNPRCLGNYDFEHIASFARKRFIEGCDTVALLAQATTEREREEIALVCMLSVQDDLVHDLRLDCRHAGRCKATDCRERLKKLIEQDIAARGVA